MINLLYDLQLSVLDSLDDGNFIMTTDSNVNVATVLIKNLLNLSNNIKIYVLVPPKSKILNFKNYLLSDIQSSNLDFIEYKYYGNPFVDRMSFFSRDLIQSLKNLKVDIVYTNDPCKVLGYKTVLYSLLSKPVPVMSRNHWVTGKTDYKVPQYIDFALRQCEGALYSDNATFNSKFAVDSFLYNAEQYLNKETIESLSKKLDHIECVDIDKIDQYRTDEKFDEFTMIFANRLSYYTGWKETLDAINRLWKRRKDFQVIVPDPGNKFKQEDLFSEYNFIKTVNKDTWTHEDYIKTCWKVDACIGNHKYPATWGGLAITEPMAAYSIPIIPKRHAYLEMFDSDSHSFFTDENDLIRAIEFYLDNREILEKDKLRARAFCEKNLSPQKFAEFILDKLNMLCIS
ncbi:glycosyltransferase [Candidatus Daviesbacteria bacterium]|nr:glycosyltransferase [Candidatus Daviesbacteria bacterium]